MKIKPSTTSTPRLAIFSLFDKSSYDVQSYIMDILKDTKAIADTYVQSSFRFLGAKRPLQITLSVIPSDQMARPSLLGAFLIFLLSV